MCTKWRSGQCGHSLVSVVGQWSVVMRCRSSKQSLDTCHLKSRSLTGWRRDHRHTRRAVTVTSLSLSVCLSVCVRVCVATPMSSACQPHVKIHLCTPSTSHSMHSLTFHSHTPPRSSHNKHMLTTCVVVLNRSLIISWVLSLPRDRVAISRSYRRPRSPARITRHLTAWLLNLVTVPGRHDCPLT